MQYLQVTVDPGDVWKVFRMPGKGRTERYLVLRYPTDPNVLSVFPAQMR